MTNNYREENVKVSKRLGISRLSVNLSKMASDDASKKLESVNHVFCIDISGSMYNELPLIRTQLKSRLVEIVGNNDTVTLIWFDHKCGYVVKMLELSSVDSVRSLNSKIDELLRPGGCTNFYDPLVMTSELMNSYKSSNNFNFIFMSDGYHNCGASWDSIIEKIREISSHICSSTVIEYGYYADTNRLTEMARELGGTKIFSEDFDKYEVEIESALSMVPKVSRVSVDIAPYKSKMKYQFMYSINYDRKSVNVYDANRVTNVLVPCNVDDLYFITDNLLNNDELNSSDVNSRIYAAIYVLAGMNKYDIVEEMIHSLHDKELIDKFNISFGKQRLEEFKSLVLNRIFNKNNRIEYCYSDYKPSPSKYCVLDLFDDLINSNSEICISHSKFEYNRTTAKSVAKRELTEEESAKLSSATTKSKVDKVMKEIDSNSVKMRIKDPNKGYPVSNLTLNSERANVSFLVNIGVVLDLPKNNPIGINSLDSSIFRNYTFIKDGILNINKLPIKISNSVLKGKFKRMGLVETDGAITSDGISIIDLSKLPITNKKRTKSVFMDELAELEAEHLILQCKSKYLKYLLKQYSKPNVVSNPTGSSVFDNPKSAEYLKSLGITKSGYSPKTEKEKSEDYYIANSLVTRIKGFSSLPTIESVLNKKGNISVATTSIKFMYECIKLIDSMGLSTYDEVALQLDITNKASREVLNKIASKKFSLIMSRSWFKDVVDEDTNNTVIYANNTYLDISFKFEDKTVNL